ncbi:MAG: DUF917 domain-containing protein [Thermoleophilia bacterium]|nr:DUF917 domain-containing protein [Thermoleophilia bacterium]
MRLLGEDDLEDLALGAAILGTGGGGSPTVGVLFAREEIRARGPVTVVELDEVPDEALVVPAAGIGSPTIIVEKLFSGSEALRAFEALQEYLGRTITHTVSAEAGGLNSVVPFAVAARLGLPIVDADFIGRAFPEIQMCLPTLYGISAGPLALADEKGNTTIVRGRDNHWTERLTRAACVEMGCMGVGALYAQSGSELKRSAVGGTLGLAQELGRLVREARADHRDPIAAALERLGGVRLFRGKIVDVDRRTVGGWTRGEARVEGVDGDAGSTLTIAFQNEHLVARHDGTVVASVPDLIFTLDSETGEAITTEELRYGFRVTVGASPCDPRWRSPEGLALAGPRYFGYELDYVPVEELAASP